MRSYLTEISQDMLFILKKKKKMDGMFGDGVWNFF